MAIQMRRGQYKDFDPDKMLPGEWAVAIDNDTQHQVIWMCFRAGVVKRIGTYEDFYAQIEEATGDIREAYEQVLTQIKEEAESARDAAAKSETNAAASEKKAGLSESSALTYSRQAAQSASEALASKGEAENWRKLAESYAHGQTNARDGEATDNAQYYYEQAKRVSDAPYITNEDTGKRYIYSIYARDGIPHMALVEKTE